MGKVIKIGMGTEFMSYNSTGTKSIYPKEDV